ncbi:MAG TPA: hypothetical protein VE959_30170 [Bryobacteraceae bacterium]|nr:hypothetical protein [Bryobacteraceae bacterium]
MNFADFALVAVLAPIGYVVFSQVRLRHDRQARAQRMMRSLQTAIQRQLSPEPATRKPSWNLENA